MAEDRSEKRQNAGEADGDGSSERESRSRFSLPPIRLPPFFPADFRLVFPVPGRVRGTRVGARGVLAIALVVDLVDAAMLLAVPGQYLLWRSMGVVVLAAVAAGPAGLLSVWEPLAVAVGYPTATVLPSVTALVLARAWLE